MMKKQTNKTYSVLVYIKTRYKYSNSEEQLSTLCQEKFHGRFVGGGTDLSTGKRDQQFIFQNEADVKAFLKHPFTRTITLKGVDVDLVDQ